MSVEIRPAREEEMGEFFRVANLSLINTSGENSPVRPEYTLCCFEDGKLTTSYAAWPERMRFNGNSVPVAGVTYVGTLPVYRRKGYLRQIKQQHFRTLYEQGERHIAILWASMAAIYQRYGYGVVSTSVSYEIEPRFLSFALPCSFTGSFREAEDNELPVFTAIYDKFSEPRTGFLVRTDERWKATTMSPARDNGHLSKLVYTENGEPIGYIVYTVQSSRQPGERSRLLVRDLAWNTISTYRAIWEHLANMDLIGNIHWWLTPEDDPLPFLLLEPRRLNRKTYDGLLGRLVNVEKALISRPYHAEGKLVFEVRDDLCAWNEGRWKLEACAAGSKISRTEEEPQITMPVSTLAMLVFGQISATQAARMGRCDVSDYAALPVWDNVMRTAYRPSCADRF